MGVGANLAVGGDQVNGQCSGLGHEEAIGWIIREWFRQRGAGVPIGRGAAAIELLDHAGEPLVAWVGIDRLNSTFQPEK